METRESLRRVFRKLGKMTLNRRRIVVGLKSDHFSREMLLRLLHSGVVRGDNVLAIHVQQSDDTFDPNTFYIHEDLCKSKQVEFEVKICTGSCYITELSHQVRMTFATILVVGCSRRWPKYSAIAKCLKALPPTCKLLIMDNGGEILFQEMGTSQQGLISSSLSESNGCDQPGTIRMAGKSLSVPSSPTALTTKQTESANFSQKFDHDLSPKFFNRLDILEVKSGNRRFTYEELNHATRSFGCNMLIGEGAHSQVYRAVFENGRLAAVKVLRASKYSEELFFREVEILSGLKHENVVQLLGYCHCKELYAIVYNLLDSSMKQRLNHLKWNERMGLAIGVAKALEYLHSCCPPIVHKDVNSSNILLSQDGNPHLSDFGSAKADFATSRLTRKKPIHVIGTFGYLAPEYVMYGTVDEKIDVYSYGVVLLELITGKEAIQTSPVSNQESFVFWASSLINCENHKYLIDPKLDEDYEKDEMKAIMTAARLCLFHSPSRRPTMKTILHCLKGPNYVLEMQKERGDSGQNGGKYDINEYSRQAISDSITVSHYDDA